MLPFDHFLPPVKLTGSVDDPIAKLPTVNQVVYTFTAAFNFFLCLNMVRSSN
jgi:hypothetical protein